MFVFVEIACPIRRFEEGSTPSLHYGPPERMGFTPHPSHPCTIVHVRSSRITNNQSVSAAQHLQLERVMSWLNALICGWCRGRRARRELNVYRQHTLICVACTHTDKVSKDDYIPLNKKG